VATLNEDRHALAGIVRDRNREFRSKLESVKSLGSKKKRKQATRLTCATADPNCCHLACTAQALLATKLPAPSQARAVGPAELTVRPCFGRSSHVESSQTDSKQSRLFLAVIFGALVFWQVYIAIFSFRLASVRDRFFESLGVDLPTLTKLIISSLSFGPVIPIVTALVAADVLRRKRLSSVYGAVALGLALLVTAGYQAAIMEAWFRPLFSLIEQIG
jgi:hypothetical protein